MNNTEDLELTIKALEKLGDLAEKATQAQSQNNDQLSLLVELGRELEAKDNRIKELELNIERLKFIIDTQIGYHNN